MKKLALLLFCAVALLPLANAQECPNSIDCTMDPTCSNCHYQAYGCRHYNHLDCISCNQACAPIEDGLTHKAPPMMALPGHTSLNELGAAFLAATMPSFLRSPAIGGRLPANHPKVPEIGWARLQAKMAERNKTDGMCKAPASVQILAASMLRK